MKIATLAPDSAFGRDGVAAFKDTAEQLGATIVRKNTLMLPEPILQRTFKKSLNLKPDYLFVVWAGANSPWKQIIDMKVRKKALKFLQVHLTLPH